MENLKTFEEFVKTINEEKATYLTEVAKWDNPEKKKRDANTISCDDDDEGYEREPIRRAVKRMYPSWFTTDQINTAIEHCCKKAGQSRQREDFYKCVLDKLFTFRT